MAYVIAAEVIARLGTAAAAQLTTESGDTPDSAMITLVIAEVEGRADAAVRSRIATPVDAVGYPKTFAALRGIVMSMAIYALAVRRPPVPKDWTEANEQALRWLAGLAEGKIALPDAGLNSPAPCWGSSAPNAAVAETE